MIHCVRTDSNDPHFQKLAAELEEGLRLRDGENHPFYSSLNRIGFLGQVIMAFEGRLPVGSGAIRQYSPSTVEIKRMYTRPEKRGLGIASLVLRNLEEWARELNYSICLLETGQNQPEAVSFYRKNDYLPIPRFGQYRHSENSLCFQKSLL